jgi:hypothetical protein
MEMRFSILEIVFIFVFLTEGGFIVS